MLAKMSNLISFLVGQQNVCGAKYVLNAAVDKFLGEKYNVRGLMTLGVEAYECGYYGLGW